MEIVNGKEITYLNAQGQPFAIHKKSGESEIIDYLHLDYQGSIMAITNQSGTIILEERNYDAWGRPRTASTLAYVLPNPFGSGSEVKRGYTFHEHLEEFNLINMNGRMYDPLLARFLNADPLLQDNTDGQNYNRYSYVLNNPTKYTDPSGYAYSGFTFSSLYYNTAGYDNLQNEQQEAYLDFKNGIAKQSFHEMFDFTKGAGFDPANVDGDPIKLTDAERKAYQKYGVTPEYAVCITPKSGVERNYTNRVGTADYVGYVVDAYGFISESTENIEYLYGERINDIILSAPQITAKNAAVFKVVTKSLNVAGGVIGIYDCGAQAIDDYSKGDYVLGTYELSKGLAYSVGTGMLFTPLAPIGGTVLLITGAVDVAGDISLYLWGTYKK
jgi:RHS repeat-associated protein